ncbi:aminoglycoside phosphotransferase family protein [Streptomyces sp. NPDC047072]|uniref:phosphotransferase family protein n=1 Tax=Streptomyces sp. NPDC047072 TaxID=3154809 RepID=UPI00340B6833
MAAGGEEVPLSGGRITAGVVRIADTVRRPTSASSPYVAVLLTHLERQGFSGAPRHLGTDERGRDVLSHIPGEVPSRFQRWTDAQVAAAGRLLRNLHHATRTLPGAAPVVCHHDPGPNNTVFRTELPVAFIDFDTAAPGDPLEDLAYMAWTWCVSSRPDRGPVELQAAQVRLLADAYGLPPKDRPRLFDAITERQTRNANWWRQRLPENHRPHDTTTEQITDRITWSLREHNYTATHRTEFHAALH